MAQLPWIVRRFIFFVSKVMNLKVWMVSVDFMQENNPDSTTMLCVHTRSAHSTRDDSCEYWASLPSALSQLQHNEPTGLRHRMIEF